MWKILRIPRNFTFAVSAIRSTSKLCLRVIQQFIPQPHSSVRFVQNSTSERRHWTSIWKLIEVAELNLNFAAIYAASHFWRRKFCWSTWRRITMLCHSRKCHVNIAVNNFSLKNASIITLKEFTSIRNSFQNGFSRERKNRKTR